MIDGKTRVKIQKYHLVAMLELKMLSCCTWNILEVQAVAMQERVPKDGHYLAIVLPSPFRLVSDSTFLIYKPSVKMEKLYKMTASLVLILS